MMTSAPVRVGIFSFAHYHANFWAEAFRDDPRVRLQGIHDDDHGRGIDAAARFGALFMPQPETLIGQVDAVAITSETADHLRWIALAAAHDLPILCEKPLAVSLAQVEAIERALASSPALFMHSFPKRLDPANLALKALIDRGDLGRIWLARVRHGHAHANDPAFTAGWWTDSARSGGGTLIDEGIHAADFLAWLFGPPASVQATLGRSAGLAVEDAALATFRWADGMIGEIATGWRFHAADVSVEIYGDKGTALLSGVDLASKAARAQGWLRVAAHGSPAFQDVPVTPSFGAGRFHHASASAFIDAIVTKSAPPSGLAEARTALGMILAAYSAAAGASEQPVPPARAFPE